MLPKNFFVSEGVIQTQRTPTPGSAPGCFTIKVRIHMQNIGMGTNLHLGQLLNVSFVIAFVLSRRSGLANTHGVHFAKLSDET